MTSIKAKLLAALLFLFLGMLTIGGVGWYAAKIANDGLYTVFKDRVEPLRDLKTVSDLYAVNIVDTAHKVRNGNLDWVEGQKAVAEAEEKIKKYWNAYSETYMDDSERKLASETSKLMQVSDVSVKELAGILGSKSKERLDRYVIDR